MAADPPADLSGRTIGITADRRGDDQAVMFGRMGAEVVVGPTIATVKLPDPDLLRARTEQLISDPPDYVIANTGIGMRTWMAAAEEWGFGAALHHALSSTRLTARGPKAAGALSSAGLRPWWRCPTEQLSDLVGHLAAQGLDGATVAFQLHGDDGADVVSRLEAAGARVSTLPVYVWGRPADTRPAVDLVRRCCEGGVDAVTFTAGPQVRALLGLAAEAGLEDPLRRALAAGRTVVGCIGPVCAEVAVAAGLGPVVVPGNWRLGSLVKAVAAAVVERAPTA